MSTLVPITDLTPRADARWFGDRLAKIIASDDPIIADTVAWCEHQLSSGHTCLDFNIPVIARLGQSDADGWAESAALPPQEWLGRLRECGEVAQRDIGSMHESDRVLVLEGSRLYFAASHSNEVVIARRLVELSRTGSLTIITGGPGTGKTTTASALVGDRVRDDPDAAVMLLAPTGKAAARLTESMRRAAESSDLPAVARTMLGAITAITIDLALMERKGLALAQAALVVVDECSMIDSHKMRRLLCGLAPTVKLALLGDPHQLVSIEAGTVLGDILPDGPQHPLWNCTTTLTKNWRFPEDGAIARLAAAVNLGDWEATQRCLAATSSDPGAVVWYPVSSSREVVGRALALRQELGAGVCILCGHRVGHDGSVAINRAVTRSLGVAAYSDRMNGEDFIGRPIIVTANDRATRLVNGDTGIVEDGPGGVHVARFPDRPEPVPIDRLPEHEAAYALTIHKSQGSEYDAVVVALPARPSPVLTRELLYTAITRTRGRVSIIASEVSLKAAVEQRVSRASGLRERIIEAARA